MLNPSDFKVGKHYKDKHIESIKPDTTIFKVDEYGDYYVSRDLGNKWELINDSIKAFEDTFTPFIDSLDDYGKIHNELQRLVDTGAVIKIEKTDYNDRRLISFKRGDEYITILSEDDYGDEKIIIKNRNYIDLEFCIALENNNATVKFYKGGFREMKEDK